MRDTTKGVPWKGAPGRSVTSEGKHTNTRRFSRNLIKSIPPEIASLDLEELILDRNAFNAINAGVFGLEGHFKSLKILDFSHNNLGSTVCVFLWLLCVSIS